MPVGSGHAAWCRVAAPSKALESPMSRISSCAVRSHRILFACLLSLLGCAELPSDGALDQDPPLLASTEPAASAASGTLAGATRSTLVEGITAAENLLISSDQRLFV